MYNLPSIFSQIPLFQNKASLSVLRLNIKNPRNKSMGKQQILEISKTYDNENYVLHSTKAGAYMKQNIKKERLIPLINDYSNNNKSRCSVHNSLQIELSTNKTNCSKRHSYEPRDYTFNQGEMDFIKLNEKFNFSKSKLKRVSTNKNKISNHKINSKLNTPEKEPSNINLSNIFNYRYKENFSKERKSLYFLKIAKNLGSDNLGFPGPGEYNQFSEFGIYGNVKDKFSNNSKKSRPCKCREKNKSHFDNEKSFFQPNISSK